MEQRSSKSFVEIREIVDRSVANEMRKLGVRGTESTFATTAHDASHLGLLETQTRTRAAQLEIAKEDEAADIRMYESLGMTTRGATFAARGR